MISDMLPPRPADVPPEFADAVPLDTADAPTRAQIELACRGLPVTPAQQRWAVCRPAPHRVRVPEVGAEVLYRHDTWLDPVPATVEWIQPDDDVSDPHVCQPQTDGQGSVVLVEGRPVFVTNPDAWRSLILRVSLDGAIVRPITREARLPGSPGWLPFDWQDRWRPMPWEV